MALGKPSLISIGVGARLNVDPIGFEEMFGHGLESLGTVDLQWNATPDRPGRENQVCVTDRVVGVKMSNERDEQLGRFERLNTFVEKRCASAAHNAGPEVNEVSR